MSATNLPLTPANLLLRPAFGSRREPERVFERMVGKAGWADGDEWFVDGFRPLLREWAADEEFSPVGPGSGG